MSAVETLLNRIVILDSQQHTMNDGINKNLNLSAQAMAENRRMGEHLEQRNNQSDDYVNDRLVEFHASLRNHIEAEIESALAAMRRDYQVRISE